MSTEAALRERAVIALRRSMNFDLDGGWDKAVEAVLATIAPLPVLAWCSANPEAAKGLASGEMVAVPKPIGAQFLRELLENPPPPNEALKALFREYREANQDASPPAPSERP